MPRGRGYRERSQSDGWGMLQDAAGAAPAPTAKQGWRGERIKNQLYPITVARNLSGYIACAENGTGALTLMGAGTFRVGDGTWLKPVCGRMVKVT